MALPKAVGATLALLDEFGSPETQDKVAKARKAATIVKMELEASG